MRARVRLQKARKDPLKYILYNNAVRKEKKQGSQQDVDEITDGSWEAVLRVEHTCDVDDSTFSTLGELRYDAVRRGRRAVGRVEMNVGESVDVSRALLADSVQRNEFYRVRVVPAEGLAVVTSIRACILALSQRERIVVHVDDGGHLQHAHYETIVKGGDTVASAEAIEQHCGSDEARRKFAQSLRLNGAASKRPRRISAELRFAEDAPRVPKIPPPRKGEEVDDRGFFAKYWMYILIAVIGFVLVGGGGGG